MPEAHVKRERGEALQQRREALALLNKEMTKGERYMARKVFEVNAPDELSPGAVSKVVKQEMRALSTAMKCSSTPTRASAPRTPVVIAPMRNILRPRCSLVASRGSASRTTSGRSGDEPNSE